MALDKETKDQLMEEFKRHEGDTGSPEVQIALLTTPYHPVDRSPAHQLAR